MQCCCKRRGHRSSPLTRNRSHRFLLRLHRRLNPCVSLTLQAAPPRACRYHRRSQRPQTGLSPADLCDGWEAATYISKPQDATEPTSATTSFRPSLSDTQPSVVVLSQSQHVKYRHATLDASDSALGDGLSRGTRQSQCERFQLQAGLVTDSNVVAPFSCALSFIASKPR